MNIIIYGAILAVSSFTSPEEVIIKESTDAIILINGEAMAAAITDEADVIEVYGLIPSYFNSDEESSSLIEKAKSDSQLFTQVELTNVINVVDTSQWSEFTPEEVSLIRELVMTQEGVNEPTGIMIVGNNTTSSLQIRISNLLVGFGVDQSIIEWKQTNVIDDAKSVTIGLFKIPT